MKEFIGKGSIYKLKDILTKYKPKAIFLVTGKGSYEKSGAKSILTNILKNYKVVHFDELQPNPKLEDVERGLKIFKENRCDFVIAVGGGSAIDVAKSVNVLSTNFGGVFDYVNNKKELKNRGNILVAIPTTAGSGSEATHFIVLYKGKNKCSLGHKEFTLPDYAIVDSKLTESLPAYITACTGMDALGQAIESYWSVYSTDESKKYASEAIRIILNSIRNAVNDPSAKSREAMSKGAFLAGKAINISKTTACHAIAYPITSYFKVPHGHAVGLTLASMFVYNSKVTEKDVLDKRGGGYVKKTIKEVVALLGTKIAEEAAKKIGELMKCIGLKTRLSELNIKTEKGREIIIKNGFNPERVKNNPRLLTEEALRDILDDIA